MSATPPATATALPKNGPSPSSSTGFSSGFNSSCCVGRIEGVSVVWA
jgi:hypothetical protein